MEGRVTMSEQLNRIEEMIGTLIKIVGTTNARLEGVEETTNRIETKLDDQTNDIRGDVRFLNHRVADLEMELDKLKNR
jgi:archaellum component FlaC